MVSREWVVVDAAGRAQNVRACTPMRALNVARPGWFGGLRRAGLRVVLRGSDANGYVVLVTVDGYTEVRAGIALTKGE